MADAVHQKGCPASSVAASKLLPGWLVCHDCRRMIAPERAEEDSNV